MALVELLGEQIKGKDGKDVDVASFQGEGKVGVMASAPIQCQLIACFPFNPRYIINLSVNNWFPIYL